MTVKLVSLGTACRPGYHLYRLAGLHEGFQAESYPFNWTITPFTSLRTCMARSFDPQRILPPDNLVVNQWGSVTCGETELIFHHALCGELIPTFGDFAPGDRLPDTDEVRAVVASARGRFLHTYSHLEALRGHRDGIVFVRWARLHQDTRPKATHVYNGETNESLMALLSEFLGHEDYHVLVVDTEILPDRREVIDDPIADFRAEGRLIATTVRERQGWNGDGTDNYKGDEPSWDAAFDRAMSHWALTG